MSKNIYNELSKKLRHQISFIENLRINETDEDDWQEKLITYAQIKPLNQYNYKTIENFNFNHVMTEALYIFKIRFIENLHNKLRITFEKRQFEIKRIVNQDERNVVITIIALEL